MNSKLPRKKKKALKKLKEKTTQACDELLSLHKIAFNN
jgi:hypothetical protein